MPRPPNIVLICVDQMRWDCLSIAGHHSVETPHLDLLAHQGVRFTNAYSAVPSCIAARASLFTGLTPRSHGRVGYQDGVTWDYPVTLAGELTKAGYETIAVGKMHVHPQRNQVGFEKLILHDGMTHHYRNQRQSDYVDWVLKEFGLDRGFFDHGMESNSWVARPWHLPEHAHPSYWVTSRAIESLRERDASRPTFLYLSFVAPHAPLVPPEFYLNMYLRQDLPAPPVGDWVHKLGLDFDQGRWHPSTGHGRLDPRAQHRAQAAYYGLITQIDHQIGRLLEHMHDLSLRENTVIAFVSDHGELMGDHHLFRKIVPYAGSARVPLILNFPQGTDFPRGRLQHELVELRDVMPTLLDVAGAPISASVEGRSVLPLLRGEPAGWRKHLHGEHVAREGNQYIVEGGLKYIWYTQTGLEQLFDTQADPLDMHDLVNDPAHRGDVERLRGLLIQELAGREEGYTDGRRLIVGRPAKPVLSHALKSP